MAQMYQIAIKRILQPVVYFLVDQGLCIVEADRMIGGGKDVQIVVPDICQIQLV